MIGLDTNVLLRYIAQDDAVQSPIATRYIEHTCTLGTPGFVSLVSILELVWISKRRYAADRNDVAAIVGRILGIKQLVVQEAGVVELALIHFEASNLEFADCLLLQLALANGCSPVVTFDKKAAKAGMSLLE